MLPNLFRLFDESTKGFKKFENGNISHMCTHKDIVCFSNLDKSKFISVPGANFIDQKQILYLDNVINDINAMLELRKSINPKFKTGLYYFSVQRSDVRDNTKTLIQDTVYLYEFHHGIVIYHLVHSYFRVNTLNYSGGRLEGLHQQLIVSRAQHSSCKTFSNGLHAISGLIGNYNYPNYEIYKREIEYTNFQILLCKYSKFKKNEVDFQTMYPILKNCITNYDILYKEMIYNYINDNDPKMNQIINLAFKYGR